MATVSDTTALIIGSPAFATGEMIPSVYTGEGKNINPSLTIENIPPGTKSLALLVEDPDGGIRPFVHWIVWNIRPREMILENTVPGMEGKNGFGKFRYVGPCPPTGTHRYFFKVFALDALLSIRGSVDKEHLEKSIQKHLLARGELVGLYKRSKVKNSTIKQTTK